MDGVRTGSLLLATMTMGLVAGTFVLYAHTVMPGLRATDDRTFVTAFASLDRSIVNPWFMITAFLGAAGFTALAAVVHRGSASFPWIGRALVAYVVVVAITAAVHVPLNDAIKRAAAASVGADAAQIRRRFHESRWVAWNLARVVLSATAFGQLAWALVEHGRATVR